MSAWGGRLAQQLARRVVETYGTRCWHCRQPIDLTLPRSHPWSLSVEHIKPRSSYPPELRHLADRIENLRPAHRQENISRGPRAGRVRRPRRLAAELAE